MKTTLKTVNRALLSVSLIVCGFSCGAAESSTDGLVLPGALTIVTGPALPRGFASVSYDTFIGAEGGTGEGYRWSIAAGDLPPGLTLDPTGTPLTRLRGVPASPGRFTFIVQVEDSSAASATRSMQLEIVASTLVITTAPMLPVAAENEPYEVSLRAEGGTDENYRWSIVEGRLPTNVFLTSAGTPETLIAGTPRNRGQFIFAVQVEDSDGNVAQRQFTLNVTAGAPAVRIDTQMLPEGVADELYTATISARDGSGDGYMWSLVQGRLPPGLGFSPTGMTTTISGTPLQEGAYSFRIRVTDSQGDSDEQTFVLVIRSSDLAIEIVSTTIPDARVGVPYSPNPPDGGPVLVESVGGRGTARVWSVVNGSLPPGLIFAAQSGRPRFAEIAGIPTSTGNYAFRVRVEDEAGDRAERSYFLIVQR